MLSCVFKLNVGKEKNQTYMIQFMLTFFNLVLDENRLSPDYCLYWWRRHGFSFPPYDVEKT